MSMMTRIDDLFEVHRARSGLLEEYEPGDVAYLANARDFHGVIGFVTPNSIDEVFESHAIVVNAFSRSAHSLGARVHAPPFIASGRSGNGLTVLVPKAKMSQYALTWYAAYLNRVHGWRFTWYRQATADKISALTIPAKPGEGSLVVSSLIPARKSEAPSLPRLQFRSISLGALFHLIPGDFHSTTELEPGTTPLVSCGEEKNGIIGHYTIPADKRYSHKLTIAFNGSPLNARFHPYEFGAKDDVAVAVPKDSLAPATLLFIQLQLNRQRWRYSYYRKCFAEKLGRFEILLPWKAGKLDEAAMEAIAAQSGYWPFLREAMRSVSSGPRSVLP